MNLAIPFVIAMSIAIPAQAAVCGQSDKMTETLAKKFSEYPRGRGVGSPKSLIELYVSSTGTCTVVVSTLTGLSCIVATCTGGWTEYELPPVGTAL